MGRTNNRLVIADWATEEDRDETQAGQTTPIPAYRGPAGAGQRTREAVAARTASQGVVPLRGQNRRGEQESLLGVS